jgi:LPS export ABC transporter protein LptC
MSIRNALGFMLLVCAAAATWYLSLPPAVAPADREADDTGPLGYYLKGARLLGTNDDGDITYVVIAERAEELPEEAQLELRNVLVEYRPEHEIPWLVSATSARAPKAGSYLDLMGDVQLRSLPADGSEPTVISTDSLRFAPNEYTAQAGGAVALQVGGQRLEAVGLWAHLKDDSVKLESNVHGQFVP